MRSAKKGQLEDINQDLTDIIQSSVMGYERLIQQINEIPKWSRLWK